MHRDPPRLVCPGQRTALMGLGEVNQSEPLRTSVLQHIDLPNTNPSRVTQSHVLTCFDMFTGGPPPAIEEQRPHLTMPYRWAPIAQHGGKPGTKENLINSHKS